MSAPAVEESAVRGTERDPVVVIGAGPAGLAAAEHLLDHGLQVVVVDGAARVGGLSRSLQLWGRSFDLGPHSFYSSSHPESVARWLDLAQGRVERTVARRDAVWRGRVVGFPPGPRDVLRTAGVAGAARLGASTAKARVQALARARLHPTTPRTAEEALVARHGRAVVEELFVPYCRKYLGTHPGELSPAFADRLLGTRTGFTGPVELLTPSGGTGAVWEELARRLRARGARILLGAVVTGLAAGDGRVHAVRVRDGGPQGAESTIACRAVVASVPPPVLLRWLPGTTMPTLPPGAALRSRDTYLVHLLVEGRVGQDAHYVTGYDESLRTGRLTNTSVWRPQTFRDSTTTVLCAEFWSSGDDDLARRSDEELVRLAVGELPAFGVSGAVRVVDTDVLRLPRSVPVLSLGFEGVREDLDAQLDAFTNLARVGRHGTHSWDGQEDSLLTGRSIGAHVLGLPA